MANIKEILNSSKYDSIKVVLNKAGNLGDSESIDVYVVGGFVRDLLMGNTINDIDIMTIGEGIPFAKKLAYELGHKKIVPFKKFGRHETTITLLILQQLNEY